MNTAIQIALIAGLAAVGALLASMESQEEILEREQYCNMIDQYERTGGQFGWANYDKSMGEKCK